MAELKVMFGGQIKPAGAAYWEFHATTTLFLRGALVRGTEKKRIDPNGDYKEMYYVRSTRMNPYGTLYVVKTNNDSWDICQVRRGSQSLPKLYDTLRVVVLT